MLLLNHDFCKIELVTNEYQVRIKMLNGQWVNSRPYPGDLKGAIAALTLSLDVLSGKVILQNVVTSNNVEVIESPKLLGDNK